MSQTFKKAIASCIICNKCYEKQPNDKKVIVGAWDGLRYFIVALPEPSI